MLDKFKLLALPLARPHALPASSSSSTHQPIPLFYLHAKKVETAPATTARNGEQEPKPPVMTRVTDWAATQWNKLADGPPGGWKQKTFVRLSLVATLSFAAL